MSWSVQSVGTPTAVKADLVKKFESAKISTKSIPHELKSVELIEQIVNDQLDFLADIPNYAVNVSANGSVYKNTTSDGKIVGGNSSVKVSVEAIYGWVG